MEQPGVTSARRSLSSNHQNTGGLGNEGATVKTRKPYTITKQRERWTDEEHQKFLDALRLHGRAWRKIEEYIGTKTAVQIRSHAQKFFSKVERLKETGETQVGEEVIAIPPPRPKRKPARPYPRNQRGATNGGGSTSCNEGISENNCGAEYSQPQMGGTTANTNTMGQSNLSSQVHLPQPYHAANGAGGRSNCGPSEMEMGGAMCMAQDQDDGEVTEMTIAAVAAAASAAAAAAAAAVVAAAGQQVQAHLQTHPPLGFPFFGLPPGLLAQVSVNNPALEMLVQSQAGGQMMGAANHSLLSGLAWNAAVKPEHLLAGLGENGLHGMNGGSNALELQQAQAQAAEAPKPGPVLAISHGPNGPMLLYNPHFHPITLHHQATLVAATAAGEVAGLQLAAPSSRLQGVFASSQQQLTSSNADEDQDQEMAGNGSDEPPQRYESDGVSACSREADEGATVRRMDLDNLEAAREAGGDTVPMGAGEVVGRGGAGQQGLLSAQLSTYDLPNGKLRAVDARSSHHPHNHLHEERAISSRNNRVQGVRGALWPGAGGNAVFKLPGFDGDEEGEVGDDERAEDRPARLLHKELPLMHAPKDYTATSDDDRGPQNLQSLGLDLDAARVLHRGGAWLGKLPASGHAAPGNAQLAGPHGPGHHARGAQGFGDRPKVGRRSSRGTSPCTSDNYGTAHLSGGAGGDRDLAAGAGGADALAPGARCMGKGGEGRSQSAGPATLPACQSTAQLVGAPGGQLAAQQEAAGERRERGVTGAVNVPDAPTDAALYPERVGTNAGNGSGSGNADANGAGGTTTPTNGGTSGSGSDGDTREPSNGTSNNAKQQHVPQARAFEAHGSYAMGHGAGKGCINCGATLGSEGNGCACGNQIGSSDGAAGNSNGNGNGNGTSHGTGQNGYGSSGNNNGHSLKDSNTNGNGSNGNGSNGNGNGSSGNGTSRHHAHGAMHQHAPVGASDNNPWSQPPSWTDAIHANGYSTANGNGHSTSAGRATNGTGSNHNNASSRPPQSCRPSGACTNNNAGTGGTRTLNLSRHHSEMVASGTAGSGSGSGNTSNAGGPAAGSANGSGSENEGAAPAGERPDTARPPSSSLQPLEQLVLQPQLPAAGPSAQQSLSGDRRPHMGLLHEVTPLGLILQPQTAAVAVANGGSDAPAGLQFGPPGPQGLLQPSSVTTHRGGQATHLGLQGVTAAPTVHTSTTGMQGPLVPDAALAGSAAGSSQLQAVLAALSAQAQATNPLASYPIGTLQLSSLNAHLQAAPQLTLLAGLTQQRATHLGALGAKPAGVLELQPTLPAPGSNESHAAVIQSAELKAQLMALAASRTSQGLHAASEGAQQGNAHYLLPPHAQQQVLFAQIAAAQAQAAAAQHAQQELDAHMQAAVAAAAAAQQQQQQQAYAFPHPHAPMAAGPSEKQPPLKKRALQ